jgi:ParB-like chromosome segregation protein Spo0J
MREISLASWEDAPRRVNSIKRSLELIYGVKLEVDLEDISLDRLYPTEEFLENDKLALVFMKIVTEGYDVPIIAVKRDEDYFVLDGHHRSFIFKKFSEKTIKAYVLKFPKNTSYRTIEKRPLEELPIRAISTIDDIILKAWQRILGIMKHYEAIYHVSFNLKTEQVCLEDLVPTQPQVIKAQINSIKEPLVPIACIQYQGKYYILDGHARSLRAKQLGQESTKAIVLLPPVNIDFGIVKTAKETNLKTLEDIRILE